MIKFVRLNVREALVFERHVHSPFRLQAKDSEPVPLNPQLRNRLFQLGMRANGMCRRLGPSAAPEAGYFLSWLLQFRHRLLTVAQVRQADGWEGASPLLSGAQPVQPSRPSRELTVPDQPQGTASGSNEPVEQQPFSRNGDPPAVLGRDTTPMVAPSAAGKMVAEPNTRAVQFPNRAATIHHHSQNHTALEAQTKNPAVPKEGKANFPPQSALDRVKPREAAELLRYDSIQGTTE